MNEYKQLTLEERLQIEVLYQHNHKQTYIANYIGKSKSTVSRELKRNRINEASSGKYKAASAQRFANHRKIQKNKSSKLTESMKTVLEEYIRSDHSPEQISDRCRQEGTPMLSHESIYQYIYARDSDLYKHLRRTHRKRKKRMNRYGQRGKVPHRTPIDHRPKGAENKTRYGHWEGDTIIGKNHKGAIISLTERKSRYQVMIKVTSKKASEISQAICKKMKAFGKLFQTVTFDNGLEFADHMRISRELGVQTYFADPYSPWQRGLNENQNGLFRQYVPKSTDFRNLTQEQITKYTEKLNNRPRKGLGYRTPKELIRKKCVALET